jgi:hypothetical protein
MWLHFTPSVSSSEFVHVVVWLTQTLTPKLSADCSSPNPTDLSDPPVAPSPFPGANTSLQAMNAMPAVNVVSIPIFTGDNVTVPQGVKKVNFTSK